MTVLNKDEAEYLKAMCESQIEYLIQEVDSPESEMKMVKSIMHKTKYNDYTLVDVNLAVRVFRSGEEDVFYKAGDFEYIKIQSSDELIDCIGDTTLFYIHKNSFYR